MIVYGDKQHAYDPDYEDVESSKHREYERLDGQCYNESLKEPKDKRVRDIKVGFTDIKLKNQC